MLDVLLSARTVHVQVHELNRKLKIEFYLDVLVIETSSLIFAKCNVVEKLYYIAKVIQKR